MWITSLKIAMKQLRMHPFFSLFNLFIIAITVAVVMIVVMRFELLSTGQGEEKKLDRTLILSRMEYRKQSNTNISALSLNFIDKYVKSLKVPEYIGIRGFEQWHYPSQGMLKKHVVFGVNSDFLHIFRYHFLYGQGFNEEQVTNSEPVALISESLSYDLFRKVDAVGKQFDLNGRKYIVQGVFKDVPVSKLFAHASVLIPHTSVSVFSQGHEFTGGFHAYLYNSDPSKLGAMQTEFNQLKANINNSMEGEIFADADTQLERVVKGYNMPSEKIDVRGQILKVILLLFVFMLLPAMNLSALNLSRYKNRIEEIAIRRSYGANKFAITMQILWETISITFLGGLAGVLMAFFAITELAQFVFSDIYFGVDLSVSYTDIPFTFTLLGLFFITILTFGALSGLIPAIIANRQSPATSLKGGSK